MANGSRDPQQRLFLGPETKVYRALLSGKCITEGRVTDKAFRLRPANERFPAETTLSIALTPEKAIGTLDCKGRYTELTLGDIERIDGLTVQRKQDDPDLLEIAGIPLSDTMAQTDYALALAKISGPPIIPKKRR